MTTRRRLVRVPASSANLGPGYDAMAAAVALHLELEVEETGEFGVDPGGLEVSTGRDNLVVRAFETLHPADGIAFRLHSEIPLARGLGSSAAAIVAGLAAADHLFELALSREELLARATEIEGHPDNVAAAIYGGFVVCSAGPDPTLVAQRDTSVEGGGPFAARFDPPEGLEGIVVIPAEEVSTRLARAAIPAELPLGDAVANVSAAALLVLGLRSTDLDLVGRGLHDRIHQPRRRNLYPRSMEIVDAAAELGALGATISGAGPTVLVWTTWEEAGSVAAALKERAEGWAEVKRLPFEPLGVDVPEL
jgi:homoserine kinase